MNTLFDIIKAFFTTSSSQAALGFTRDGGTPRAVLLRRTSKFQGVELIAMSDALTPNQVIAFRNTALTTIPDNIGDLEDLVLFADVKVPAAEELAVISAAVAGAEKIEVLLFEMGTYPLPFFAHA